MYKYILYIYIKFEVCLYLKAPVMSKCKILLYQYSTWGTAQGRAFDCYDHLNVQIFCP